MGPKLIVILLTVMDLIAFTYTWKEKDPIAIAVNQAGYTLQMHDIVTEDGYHLQMHRISAKPVEDIIPGESILMYHGLLSNGALYVVHPSNESIAFKLVQAGHDIWILHGRGISYSLAGETKNYKTPEYWDFSFHEHGYFDVPCAIDYILKTTNKEKIHYIGHSQGGASFFVALSTRPEYNEKIASAYLLTPAVFLIRSPGNDFILEIGNTLVSLGFIEINVKNKPIEALVVSFCGNRKVNYVCANLMLRIFGRASDTLDLYQFSMWFIRYVLDNGTTKQLLHFQQSINTGKFRMFDYGPNNMERYGSDMPPEYNLSQIEVPVTLLSGDKDELVSPKGTAKLATKLRNVRRNWVTTGNHLDFMFDTPIINLIIDDILLSMRS